jgi:hypothetical protein
MMNGLGLCEEAELEAQMFGLAQMFSRIPNVQFSTEPAFSQNPCSSDTSGERYPTIYSDYVFHLLFNCKNRIKNERWK